MIIVTGCAAEIAPERYAALPEVDRVLGNRAKLQPQSYLPDGASSVDLTETASHLVDGFEGKSRAFLQVQQGCDHRCTFCIIPYARGPSRSVPMGLVADQARRLVAAGYREIVLTGVDLTAYGADLPGTPSLGQMVRRLLAAVPELERLRLSSLDPAEIDSELWRLLAEEKRLMPHLHLSLQAGDDLILKRMKRRHSRAEAIAVARRARALRPEVALGADLIAGFPTETEDMFRRSLDLVAECGLAFVHVFPYSARPGTPAARMPQLPDHADQGARGAVARGRRSSPRGRPFFAGRQRNRCPDRAPGDGPRRVLCCGRVFRAGRNRVRTAHAADREQPEQPCRSAGPMRFWRRRDGPETTDVLTDESEGLPLGEETPVEMPPPEPVPAVVEAEERRGWFGRLRAGMSRSSARLTQGINTIFNRRRLDDEALLELEELLISSDMGVGVAGEVAEALRKTRFNQEVSPEEVRAALADEVIRLVEPVMKPLRLDLTKKPFVILVVGVNGSGKTTTIAKLAKQYRDDGHKVVLAAGDTFRAAAVEQLQIWGERTGCPVVTRPGRVGRGRARLRRARPGARRRQPTYC